MNKDIVKKLIALNRVLTANKVGYVVTGTTALAIHGLPVEPHDIDIKVSGLTEEQKKVFEEFQMIAGIKKNDEYPDENYTIKVCDTIVNILVAESIEPNSFISVEFVELPALKTWPIFVQNVSGAITDKMALGREKDKDFMLNLIGWLSRVPIKNRKQ